MMRHSIALLFLLASLALNVARAAEITLIGVFGDKAAILAVDGGAPKTVKVGQKLGDLTLIAVEKDQATIEIGGKRRVLLRGQAYSSTSGAASGPQSVILSVGEGGHFTAEGQINGGAIRFIVDTGASAIAIPASEATRLRIDYRSGERGVTQTAAGPTPMYIVRLDTVRVGNIELHYVDAMVIERGLNVALLGNTFLNRVEMRREGQTMTLTRRY